MLINVERHTHTHIHVNALSLKCAATFYTQFYAVQLRWSRERAKKAGPTLCYQSYFVLLIVCIPRSFFLYVQTNGFFSFPVVKEFRIYFWRLRRQQWTQATFFPPVFAVIRITFSISVRFIFFRRSGEEKEKRENCWAKETEAKSEEKERSVNWYFSFSLCDLNSLKQSSQTKVQIK